MSQNGENKQTNKQTDQPTNPPPKKERERKKIYLSIRVKYHLNKYSKISHAIK